jgi:hypothetical protein
MHAALLCVPGPSSIFAVLIRGLLPGFGVVEPECLCVRVVACLTQITLRRYLVLQPGARRSGSNDNGEAFFCVSGEAQVGFAAPARTDC